jgi:hypothetical protein
MTWVEVRSCSRLLALADSRLYKSLLVPSFSSHTVVGYGVMVNIGDSHSPARGSIPRIRELEQIFSSPLDWRRLFSLLPP